MVVGSPNLLLFYHPPQQNHRLNHGSRGLTRMLLMVHGTNPEVTLILRAIGVSRGRNTTTVTVPLSMDGTNLRIIREEIVIIMYMIHLALVGHQQVDGRVAKEYPPRHHRLVSQASRQCPLL